MYCANGPPEGAKGMCFSESVNASSQNNSAHNRLKVGGKALVFEGTTTRKQKRWKRVQKRATWAFARVLKLETTFQRRESFWMKQKAKVFIPTNTSLHVWEGQEWCSNFCTYLNSCFMFFDAVAAYAAALERGTFNECFIMEKYYATAVNKPVHYNARWGGEIRQCSSEPREIWVKRSQSEQ